jgi:hypothetical protein
VVPTVDGLKDEAIGVLVAASDTTGNAMMVAAYHVCNDLVIYESLVEELESAFPNFNAKLEFKSLESLPYLVSRSVDLIT